MAVVALALAGVAEASPRRDVPLTLVQATLTSRVPLDAKPGTRFTLAWKFTNAQGPVDPNFGGRMTIFVRLVSRGGKSFTTHVAPHRSFPKSTPSITAALAEGARYRAVLTVPRAGIARIEIGFRIRGIPRAVLFPITNDPLKH